MNLHMSKTHLSTTNNPYIKFWKINDLIDYPQIKQGNIKRDYMDDTYKSHAYHCQPMSNANIMGWEFVLPQDVSVIWDGINDPSPEHIKILDGEFYNGYSLVNTNQGNGMLQFSLNVAIETDADHFCRLTGAPNYFVNGAKAMDIILRTDYYNFNQKFFSWKMYEPNKKIVFKKGMPIAFIVNYPITLLEQTSIVIDNAKTNSELLEKQQKYREMQDQFENNSKDWEWSHFYRDGKMPTCPEGTFPKLKPVLDDL